MVFWLVLPIYSGSLKRIDYPKQICLTHPLSFECFTTLKGTNFYIFISIKTIKTLEINKNSQKNQGRVHVFTKLPISHLLIVKEYHTWYQINDN